MEEKKTMPFSFIAGILFALLALRALNYYFIVNRYFGITALLLFAAYAAFSVLLILKKREKYAIIPCAVLILVEIIYLVREIIYLVHRFRISDVEFWTYLLSSGDGILFLLAYICLIVIMVKGFSSKAQEKKCNLWFLPAALMGVRFILSVVIYGNNWDSPRLLVFAAILFTSLWVVYPERDKDVITLGKVAAKPAGTNSAARPVGTNNAAGATGTTTASGASVVDNEAYYELIKHVLLLIFTFGVWYCIWIYRMTGYTNTVRDEEERNPTNKLLLCLFVPFYSIYWTYKTAQRVDKIAAEKNVASDMTTLCLILAIFVPIIPPILIQDKINKVITAGDVQKETKTDRSETKKEEKEDVVLGSAEELKKFKELLDMGAITQEEFDAKKKQLLGL